MSPGRLEIIEIVKDEVYLWPDEDRSIHLKAVTKSGDPIELNGSEARQLAAALVKLAEQIGE
jgi:hypothetical protein